MNHTEESIINHATQSAFESTPQPFPEITAEQRRGVIRRTFLERLSTALFLLALVAYPISMLRVPAIGFNAVHVLQTVLAVVVIVTFAFRKKISDVSLILVCVSVFSLLSVGGVLQYGIMSGGFLFAIAAVFTLATTLGVRSSIAFTVAFLLCLSLAAWLHITGRFELPVEAGQYFLLPSVWATVGASFLMTAGVFIIAISSYIANTHQLVSTIIQQNKQIEHLANHDFLTGLPTLRLAQDRLDMAIEQSRRTSGQLALLYLDIDEFKSINDTFGHEAGNMVLLSVARGMLDVVRAGDTVCRIGGDEFMILLSSIPDRENVRNVCERLLKTVGRELMYHGMPLQVSMSIGVALFPDHANDGKTLRRAADAAMYEAKRMGKNRYRFVESPFPAAFEQSSHHIPVIK